MDIIKEARSALGISINFNLVETAKRKYAVVMFWAGVELAFPCQKRVYQGVGVGAIHALVCHNVAAILDGKNTFEMIVGDKKITLPVVYRKKNDNKSKFTYQVGGWRLPSESEPCDHLPTDFDYICAMCNQIVKKKPT